MSWSGATTAGRSLQNTNAPAADLKGLIKMASVVVTLRIMPNSPSADLSKIEPQAKKEIVHFCNSKEMRSNIEPIAFGLKALNIIFVMDESKGSTEALEQKISRIENVESVEVTDVRRAIG